MADQPLVPFHSPQGLPVAISASSGALGSIFFLFALIFWIIYTLVAVYHWVKFSHAAAVAYPAITLHLIVSVVIVLYALSGLAGLL